MFRAKSEGHTETNEITSSNNSSDETLLNYLQHIQMQSNYKPIVIKILIEKGIENNYTASNQEIKHQIELLNFDKKDFSLNNVDDSVYRALNPYVLFDGNTASLDYKFTSDDERKQCLKVCGQKIIQWHIENITNQNFSLWRVKPGRGEEGWKYQNEFLMTNSIGVGWNDLGDLSGFNSESDVNAHIDSIKPGFESKSSVTAISHKMSEKDIVVVTRAQQEIVDYGIIVSKYEFEDKGNESYAHRRNVIWLNQGPIPKADFPDEHFGGSMQAAHEVHDPAKKIFIDFILIKQDHSEYYLLRYNGKDRDSQVEERWKDKLGERYHFGKNVQNQKKLREAGIGTKTIWYITKDLPTMHFWGYGSVKELITNKVDEDWNLIYDDFHYFEKDNDSIVKEDRFLKRANDSIKQQIENLPNYNSQLSMIKITKKIYQQIIGEDLIPEEDELYDVTDSSRIIDILRRKKNIILYGPPGTGKTFTAKQIAEQMKGVIKFVTFHQSYGYEEFIEGIRPESTDNGITYLVKPGVFKKFCKSLPRMSWKQAAFYVLNEENNKSLHYEQINKISIELGVDPIDTWQKKSGYPRKTPHYTQLREMTEDIRINSKNSIFKKSLDDNSKEIPGMYELNKNSKNYDNMIKELNSLFFNDSETPKIFIIDEINRGNISKIFGELITIIENDKREIPVTLAYSGEQFSVPSNVYIIGTMNTADQSLSHIDAALKRRFSSIEVPPDYLILKKGMNGISELLEKINQKIREKISRDKQIGHSYFMQNGKPITTINELQFVFATDIIPLLRDYFYDSDDDLMEVLGEEFIDWNEGSDRNLKEDWQNNSEIFRTAIKKAYAIQI